MSISSAGTLKRSDVRKEGRLEAQGERLLQDLVKQEKSLVLKVEEAKAKAKQTLDKAQADAARVLQEARAKAEAEAAELAKSAADEAAAIRDEVVSRAREAAEALDAKAGANQPSAVSNVLEKVLP
jgi:vacuolar-type H+-ATPase subunit H